MMRCIWKKEGVLGIVILTMAGCAGGSGNGSAGAAGQSLKVGEAQIVYKGSAKPAVLGYESGLTVSSLAGVSMTNFTVEPAANLNDTTVAYLGGGVTGGVSTYQHGQTQTGILTTSYVAYGIAFDHNGHLYTTGVPSSSYVAQITKSYYDGSDPAAVYASPPTTASYTLAVTPNNATIVGDGDGIFTVSSTGTGFLQLDPVGVEPTVSPGGTTVAYVKTGTKTNKTNQIWTVPIGGGTPTQLTDAEANLYYPVYSPDGQQVLVDYDNGSSRSIISYYTGGTDKGAGYAPYTPYSGWASHPAISPDGRYLAYAYSATYNPTSTTIVVQDAHGQSLQTVGVGSAPIWSPFPSNKTFIGSSGSMFTAAAGFVFTQIQSGFQSLLTFTATTSSTATATLNSTNSPESTGPVVYALHADSITGIKYVNGYYLPPVSITPGTTDALVTIDATSGQVTLVAPFVAARGASLLASKALSGLVYKAHFTGIWNAHGKNLAPKGADSIALDAKGRIIQPAN